MMFISVVITGCSGSIKTGYSASEQAQLCEYGSRAGGQRSWSFCKKPGGRRALLGTTTFKHGSVPVQSEARALLGVHETV